MPSSLKQRRPPQSRKPNEIGGALQIPAQSRFLDREWPNAEEDGGWQSRPQVVRSLGSGSIERPTTDPCVRNSECLIATTEYPALPRITVPEATSFRRHES